MLPFAYYLLKITICSAVLFGYYWFGLRNKVFHGYNRFYLLAIVGLSLVLPLCRIHIFQEKHVTQTSVIKMLQVVTASDEYMDEVVIGERQKLNFSFIEILPLLYVLVSIVFFIMLIQMLFSIFILWKKHKAVKIEQIHFINTDAAKGTPFSFFKYIFWNEQIDMHSPAGKRIFKHELAHIQERHSWDKMFINLVLIVFWSNPIFWLIRREISMIHEFVADKRAVEDGDTTALAAMILATTYPQHNINIANKFFYSPIKRRLMMLRKNKNPRVNYFSRLLVLPLLAIVFAAFTIKAREYKENQTITNKISTKIYDPNISKAVFEPQGLLNDNSIKQNTAQNILTDNQIIVVIDAGHGGTDPGVTNKDGITEKDVALQLVKKIKAGNTNENVKIILTRETDVFANPKAKAAFANAHNANLFISIHLDNTPKEKWNTVSGLNVFVSKEGSTNTEKSKLLASAIIGSFKNNYGLEVDTNAHQRQHGIWILQANSFPSVLIEAGYLTNDGDAAYLLSKKGQETFAKNVLNAINNFAQAADFTSTKVSGINGDDKIKLLEKITDAKKIDPETNYVVNANQSLNTFRNTVAKDSNQILIGINGNFAANNYYSNFSLQKDDNIKVYNNQLVFSKLGVSKSGLVANIERQPNQDTSIKYKGKTVKYALVFPEKKSVKLTFKDKSTKMISIKEANGAGIRLPAPPPVTPRVIASQSTLNDNASTIMIPALDANRIVFTQAEHEPEFPGGTEAWKNFLQKYLDPSIPVKEKWKPGMYTLIIKFIVEKDGSLSDISTENYVGTKTAQSCINLIKNGTKWKPAIQNGHMVAAYRKQPITFLVSE